jgi:hypothetical protein
MVDISGSESFGPKNQKKDTEIAPPWLFLQQE